MKHWTVLTVIVGLILNVSTFKLGGNEEHNHDKNHSHDQEHIHEQTHNHGQDHNHDHDLNHDGQIDHKDNRKGKAVLPNDSTNTNVSGLPIDFTRAVPVQLDDGKVKNCVEKEEFREELKKDPVLECVHTSVERCHITYKTQFVPIQEKVCSEHYTKHCTINYRKVATNETFLHCYNPLVRDCSEPETGDETCKQYYESSCTTKYVEKAPGKFVGDTSCQKIPINLCGDVSCKLVPGAQECHNKTTASLMDQPEEHCDLFPQKTCQHKTSLVPRLKPESQCTIVPKEVCNIKYVNIRVEKVPFKTLWCTEEEDIETFEDFKPVPDVLPGYENPTTDTSPEKEDIFPSSFSDMPENDIDLPDSQVAVIRPPLPTTTTELPTTSQIALKAPKTVTIDPESLKEAVTKAIRQAVSHSVSNALELQETAHKNQQSLKLTLQEAVEDAVIKAVLQSIQKQNASRRPQSSTDLAQAIKEAVNKGVESSIEQLLRASGKPWVVMTLGMKSEMNVMETVIKKAVLQAVRSAVRNALSTAIP